MQASDDLDEAPVWSPEDFAQAVHRVGLQPTAMKKQKINITPDPDVVAWFKQQAGERGCNARTAGQREPALLGVNRRRRTDAIRSSGSFADRRPPARGNRIPGTIHIDPTLVEAKSYVAGLQAPINPSRSASGLTP
ncbi:MAG TPA: hypothetical protein PK440_11635 [Candidatus Accumulibacter phosphatis]|nr:hypothetical protein [Accumulibacter sp.]HRL77693.1 hypothetical protein [Candidatus Accumulibacter phosphatis]HRQ95628.1 hypothetical protein [Candidatus Accumulibacter phosphatis]